MMVQPEAFHRVNGFNAFPLTQRGQLGQSKLTYLLPWSWGTVTSTCSFEELPPLSVQVIVMV
jgi:hypothetical protein